MAELRDELVLEYRGALRSLSDFARRAEKESVTTRVDADTRPARKSLDGLKKAMKAGLAAAGVAAGAAFAVGFAGALDIDEARAKLEAQLAGTGVDASAAGAAAGAVFKSGFGDSLSEVNAVVSQFVREGIAPLEADAGEAMRSITREALAVGAAFDQDVGQVARSVAAIMANDLAPNAQTAMDIVTRGLQSAGPRADDLLDTFSEYGNQFAAAGLSAEHAMSLMVAALNGGARSTDGAADAMKELFLRVTEGGGPAQDALAALGLSADDLRAQMSEGGAAAVAAYREVFAAITDTGSAAEASEAAQKLLGGTFEQVGLGGIAAMAAVSGELSGLDGAASDVADRMGSTLTAMWDRTKRSATGALSAAALAVIDFARGAAPVFAPLAATARDAFGQVSAAIGAQLAAIDWAAVAGAVSAAVALIAGFLSRMDFAAVFGVAVDVLGTVAALIGRIDFGAILNALAPVGDAIASIGDAFALVLGTFDPAPILDAFTRIGELLGRVDFGALLEPLAAGIGAIADAFADANLGEILANLADNFVATFEDRILPVVEFLVEIIGPAFEEIGEVIAGVINLVVGALEGDWSKAWEGAQEIVMGVVGAVLGIIGRLVSQVLAELGPVGAFITGIWNRVASATRSAWNAVRTVISTVVAAVVIVITTQFNVIRAIVTAVMNGVSTVISAGWSVIQTAVSVAVGVIAAVITTQFNVIRAIVTAVMNAVTSVISAGWSAITSAVGAAVAAVTGVIDAAVSFWSDALTAVWDTITGAIAAAWDAITSVIAAAVNTISGFVATAWDGIYSTVAGIMDQIASTVSSIWDGIVEGVQGALDRIVGTLQGMVGAFLAAAADLGAAILRGIVNGVSGAIGAITGIGDAVFRAVGAAVNTIIGQINRALEFTLNLGPIGSITINAPDIPLIPLQYGGFFEPTRGGVPALLAEAGNQEAVLSSANSDQRNLAILERLESGRFLDRIRSSGQPPAPAGGQNHVTNHVTVTVAGSDAEATARRIHDHLRRFFDPPGASAVLA